MLLVIFEVSERQVTVRAGQLDFAGTDHRRRPGRLLLVLDRSVVRVVVVVVVVVIVVVVVDVGRRALLFDRMRAPRVGVM